MNTSQSSNVIDVVNEKNVPVQHLAAYVLDALSGPYVIEGCNPDAPPMTRRTLADLIAEVNEDVTFWRPWLTEGAAEIAEIERMIGDKKIDHFDVVKALREITGLSPETVDRLLGELASERCLLKAVMRQSYDGMLAPMVPTTSPACSHVARRGMVAEAVLHCHRLREQRRRHQPESRVAPDGRCPRSRVV